MRREGHLTILDSDVPRRNWPVIGGFREARRVVMNDFTGQGAPDSDAEHVHTSFPARLPVDRTHKEGVTAGTVHVTDAFELRACAYHHQPLVRRAMEVEPG